MSSRILIVEDEHHLAEGIAENLDVDGYEVEVAERGDTGLDRLLAGQFDLVILDVMLPGLDGYAVCARARAAGVTTPILFLTARDAAVDRIHGLEVGGDDYLPKPFHLRELLLRVRAILRRGRPPEDALRFGENRIDFRTYSGRSWDGRDHELTHKEAMILRCLARRPSEVVTREEILDEVWGHEVFPSTRTIDNFILRLRKRFEPDPEAPAHFHTVRGVGYRFTPEPRREPDDDSF
ncbi:MAG: response regulator transcription factor [Acidobacteriota bacterium]